MACGRERRHLEVPCLGMGQSLRAACLAGAAVAMTHCRPIWFGDVPSPVRLGSSGR